MYPFFRLGWQMFRARRLPPISPLDTHVSHHLCLPWDLDGFGELNNGRVLTLYDLGRFTSGVRIGLLAALRRRRWGLAVAGASIRYRRRITAMQRIEMRTRIAGWDARFFYVLQSMWVDGACCSQALLRTAVVARGRAVPAADVVDEIGWTGDAPDLPDWVAAWIAAEGTRPWPPVDLDAGATLPEGHIPPAP
ncbi:thioesterase family protein [Jannaschia sp. S6380]|uniref:thioesterase family protein n=1 Tax=Jannaschia sp. S6380 TaxID=2926408 RepID=UPI001FF167F6|nr:thioesterase family protein [Jannaschia sp. S6380]MCK0168800.1 thioesterase family protein [Jannaschia sp. S6380]